MIKSSWIWCQWICGISWNLAGWMALDLIYWNFGWMLDLDGSGWTWLDGSIAKIWLDLITGWTSPDLAGSDLITSCWIWLDLARFDLIKSDWIWLDLAEIWPDLAGSVWLQLDQLAVSGGDLELAGFDLIKSGRIWLDLIKSCWVWLDLVWLNLAGSGYIWFEIQTDQNRSSHPLSLADLVKQPNSTGCKPNKIPHRPCLTTEPLFAAMLASGEMALSTKSVRIFFCSSPIFTITVRSFSSMGWMLFASSFKKAWQNPKSNTENKVMMNKLVAPKRCWQQPYLENSALTRNWKQASKLAASSLKKLAHHGASWQPAFSKELARHRASWQPTFAKKLQKTGTPPSKLAASFCKKAGTPASKLAASSFKKLARHRKLAASSFKKLARHWAGWQPAFAWQPASKLATNSFKKNGTQRNFIKKRARHKLINVSFTGLAWMEGSHFTPCSKFAGFL